MYNALSMLENGPVSEEQLDLYKNMLRKKLNNLQKILNNLLYWAFSQQKAIRANPKLVSIEDNIIEVTDSLNGILTEKQVSVSYQDTDVLVFLDENHLQIILSNIMYNAIKFSETQSTISIKATTLEKQIQLRITNSGKEFDWNGTADQLSAIMPKKGTSNEKGTGLGLLVCVELMRLNGGTLRAFSTLNEGKTTLELLFPLPQPLDQNHAV